MGSFISEIIFLITSVWRNLKNAESEVLLFLVGIFIAIGTITYNQIEGWALLDSLYFSVATLTTVGYGDFVPITKIGKIFTVFYILIGVVLILGFVNSLIKQSIEDHHFKQMLRDASFYNELNKFK